MTKQQILDHIAANPRAIAPEIGVPGAVLKAMEAEGLIVNVGNRSTGKRGRPPVEWAVADGSSVPAPTTAKRQTDTDYSGLILDAEAERKLAYIDNEITGTPVYGQGERSDEDVRHLLETKRMIVSRARPRQARTTGMIVA